jgi:hypothetical protein
MKKEVEDLLKMQLEAEIIGGCLGFAVLAIIGLLMLVVGFVHF